MAFILLFPFLLLLSFVTGTLLDLIFLGKVCVIDTFIFYIPFSLFAALFILYSGNFSFIGSVISVGVSVLFYKSIYIPRRYKKG